VRAPHLPVSVRVQFFMKFRGPQAHPNRIEKSPAWPASGRLAS